MNNKKFTQIIIRIENQNPNVDKNLVAKYQINKDFKETEIFRIQQEILKDKEYIFLKSKDDYFNSKVIFYGKNELHRFNKFTCDIHDSDSWKLMLLMLKDLLIP